MHGLFSGISTALAMLAFIATVFWAWNRRREGDFDRMSRLPLEEDQSRREDAQ